MTKELSNKIDRKTKSRELLSKKILERKLKDKHQFLKEFTSKNFPSIEEANEWLLQNDIVEPLDISKAKLDITLGYYYIFCNEHPLASASGKLYLHRYLASIKLGRYIRDDEHVHHIDGNRTNNNLENLQIVTHSEHAKIHQDMKPKSERVTNCKQCGKPLESHQYQNVAFCSLDCDRKSRMKFDPSKEELQELVWRHPTTKIAAMFGVSDKAVEKRCKKLDIQKPPRGYWAKLASQSQISTN